MCVDACYELWVRWCGGCVCVRACVCCNACVAPRLNPHSSHPSHLTSHIPHPHILTSPPLTPHPSPTHPHTLARHKNRATQAQRSSCVNISTTPTNPHHIMMLWTFPSYPPHVWWAGCCFLQQVLFLLISFTFPSILFLVLLINISTYNPQTTHHITVLWNFPSYPPA